MLKNSLKKVVFMHCGIFWNVVMTHQNSIYINIQIILYIYILYILYIYYIYYIHIIYIYSDFHNGRLVDTNVREVTSFWKRPNHVTRNPYVEVTPCTSEFFFELCVSPRYVQKFVKNWNNSTCIKVDSFCKSVNV